MMRRLAHWMWLGVLLAGCGEEDRPKVSDVEPGGIADAGSAGLMGNGESGAAGAAGASAVAGRGGAGTGDGGNTASSEGGAAGAVAGSAGSGNALAPVVTIVSPTELLHPSDGAVLFDSVPVLCEAVAASGGEPVDRTSVTVSLTDAAGDELDSVAADATDAEGVFGAELVVANHPAGVIGIECTATTQSSEPLATTASIQQFIDHGPVITAIVPAESEALPARDTLMQFEVAPSLLVEDDAGASVAAATLQVAGVDFELASSDAPNIYEVVVPFEDTSLFDPMPVGTVAVTVSATNSRVPEGITERLSYNFILDGAGPAISIRKPAPLSVVGGQVTLEFSVTDDYSGVAEDTIRVMINVTDPASGARYSSDSAAWGFENGTYRFSFDSAAVEGSKVQMTVNITADDLAGNSSETASALYYIDNEPPYVSLDPPQVRDLTRSGSAIYCTHPFDPVGFAAVSDLETRPLMATYRAFVLDRTNSTEGQTIFYYATVDPERTQLFLATDPTAPFIIDSNGDGECDSISGDGLELPQQELLPIGPKGDEVKDTTETLQPEASPALAEGMCQPDSSGASASMCGGASDMWRATSQFIGGDRLPAVFAVGVTNDSGVACAGSQWDLAPYVDVEGWACLAAVAYDSVGNLGVSAPLRVCLDDTTDGVEPGCTTGAVPPPECTDGCTRQPELSWAEQLLEQF